MAQLGHAFGNRALTALVAQRSRSAVQREGEPADIAAQTAFNPMNIRNRLLDAIDQSDIDPFKRPPTRHVKFDATVAVLSNLTTEEAKIVKQAYFNHENRKLTTDLFEGGESGFPTDLNESQRGQLHALLGGTRAAEGAGEAEQQLAATRLAATKAREVERLLKGKASKANVEKVMVILRQPKEANMALLAAYSRFGGKLYVDLARTDQSARADLLLEGKIVEADAMKVSSGQKAIEKLDVEIAKLEARNAPKELSLENLLTAPSYGEKFQIEAELRKLKGERKKLVDDIEARGEQTLAEAHLEGADAAARVGAVYGGNVESVAATVGGPSAAVIRAIGKADPATRIAAELRRSASEGKLTGPQLTAAIRSLRAEARAQAERELGRGHPGLDAQEATIADGYFATLRSAYDQFTSGDPKAKKFVDIINETGDRGDETVNQQLYLSAGKLADLPELVLALRGSRKDMATVERVLRNKSAQQIRDLNAAYQGITGHSLERDLFGTAGMAGQEIPESMRGIAGLGADVLGKASGTSRLNLEDFLQRPDKEGGPADVRYILARAEREYQYTIDNRGATGWWRDTWGNEQRSLLDGTIRDLRLMVLQYRRMVGWKDTKSEDVLYPQEVESPAVQKLVQDMRLARHTIRGDRAAYEEATAKLRATFEAIAMFVLQAVLTAVLTPAAAALFRAAQLARGAQSAMLLARMGDAAVRAEKIVKFATTVTAGTAANIGSTVAVTGDYSVAQLKNALLSGLAGPLGAGGMNKLLAAEMLGPVAKGLVARLGPKASAELREFAKNIASMEASAAATGESLTANLTLQGMLKEHFLSRGGEVIGAGVTKVTGLGEQAPGTGTETPPPTGGETAGAGIPAPTETTTAGAPTSPETATTVPEGTTPPAQEGGGGASGRGPGDDGGGGSSGRLPPRPLPQMSPPRPPRVVTEVITDPARAAEIFRVQARNGNPVLKAIGNREVLLREWRDANRNNLQYNQQYIDNPPLAWVDHEGNIVIDKRRVDPSKPGGVPGTGGEVPPGGGTGAAPPAADGAPRGPEGADTMPQPGGPDLASGAPVRPPAGGTSRGGAVEGQSWHPANKGSDVEAQQLYDRQRQADPDREVALIYNHDKNEWAIVQGGPNTVHLDPVLARLGWDRKSTVVARHSHPAGKLQGVLAELTHLPSGRGFDLDVVRKDSYKGPAGDGDQWHAIDIMVDGKPDKTWVVYSRKAGETGEWTVDFPDKSQRGGRGQETFATTEDYHAWFKRRFGIEVRYNPRGGAPETLPPDQLTIENDIERLARLNEQVAGLAEGKGLTEGPTGEWQAGQARAQMAEAQGALKGDSGDSGDAAVRERSVVTIIEQSVAATRAMHSGNQEPLTGERLAGLCGNQRDVTADSILSLVGDSAVPIVVERVQMADVMEGQSHSFVLVRLPGGKTYLVDTTFAQFFRKHSLEGGGLASGNSMLDTPETAQVAAQLLRDGMVALTPETARAYMLGLGATQKQAGSLGVRVLAGEASVITDIVQNGRTERVTSNDPKDLENVFAPGGKSGSVDEVRRIMSELPAGDERLPLLEDLAARLEALSQKPEPVGASG